MTGGPCPCTGTSGVMISEAAVIRWLEEKRRALDNPMAVHRLDADAKADRRQMLTAMISDVEAGLLREEGDGGE